MNAKTLTHFVLTAPDGSFPKKAGLIDPKHLTMRLDETHVFEVSKDDPDRKKSYYNALFKNATTFEPFYF